MALKNGGILFILAIACSRLPATEHPTSECDISETPFALWYWVSSMHDLVVTGDMQGTVDLGFGTFTFPEQQAFYLGLSM